MIDQETGEFIPLFIRTPYNYDTDKVTADLGTVCEKETRTQQQYKDEVDINTIVERFGVTGELPPPMNFPTEQDFEETFDFQTAMNTIVQAQTSFMTLPAKARARFNNSPQQFMEFIHDPDNIDEAIKLGIATKREPVTPTPTEIKKE